MYDQLIVNKDVKVIQQGRRTFPTNSAGTMRYLYAKTEIGDLSAKAHTVKLLEKKQGKIFVNLNKTMISQKRQREHKP